MDLARRMALLGLAVLLAGCSSKLHTERTVSLEPGVDSLFTIDAKSSEQSVLVEVKSSGGPVSVYAFLEKDQSSAQKEIDAGRVPKQVLGSAQKIESTSMTLKVPADQRAIVLITSDLGTANSAVMTLTGG